MPHPSARRLHTIIDRLLEDISYNPTDLTSEKNGSVSSITAADVDSHLGALVKDEDLSRFIL